MAQGPSPVLELIDSIRSELEQSQRELREIKQRVDQSQGEVNKLTQRNAATAAALRQITPPPEVKTAYEAAQDAQQRLFTMRNQLEKFQSDQTNKEKLA